MGAHFYFNIQFRKHFPGPGEAGCVPPHFLLSVYTPGKQTHRASESGTAQPGPLRTEPQMSK